MFGRFPRRFAASSLVFLALSAVAIGSYGYIALARVASPFALEWLEANTYFHVLRVVEAQPIYIAPSFDFIPMIYTPLYYYVAAPFALATGQIMFAMRLVSLVASLGIFVEIYALCRTRQLSHTLSILGVGLFAASYGVTGYWLDVGRVDTLFVALLLGAFTFASVPSRRDTAFGIASGATLCLSFMAKQQAALLFPFLLAFLLYRKQWARLSATAATCLLGSGVFVLGSNILSNGWFWFYVFVVPSSVPLATPMFVDFWTVLFLPSFGVLVMLIVAAMFLGRGARSFNGFLLVIATLLVPSLIISYISLVKSFGYSNALLPTAAALAVVGAEAVGILGERDRRGLETTSLRWMTLGLVVLQFALLRYDVAAQIPSVEREQLGVKLLDELRDAPAPMFAPTVPYLLHMAGQPTHFQASSYGDLDAGARRNAQVRRVFEQYNLAIPTLLGGKQFNTVVLPNRDWYDPLFNTEQGYVCKPLIDGNVHLSPMTGVASYADRLCHKR